MVVSRTHLANDVASVGTLHKEVQIRREEVFHHARHALTKDTPSVYAVLSYKIDLAGETDTGYERRVYCMICIKMCIV